jgi:hypothetical protein
VRYLRYSATPTSLENATFQRSGTQGQFSGFVGGTRWHCTLVQAVHTLTSIIEVRVEEPGKRAPGHLS